MMTKSPVPNKFFRTACLLAAGLGLPVAVGAAEDLYVEFTGTQCVDTGYFLSGNTAIVADFQMTDAAKTQALVWGAGNEMWSRLYISGSKAWSWSCMNRAGSQIAPYDNVATEKDVDCDRVVATVDGFHNVVKLEKRGGVWYEYTGSWDNLPHSETNTTTLKIGSRFTANDQGAWNYAKMKLYSFKIYEAGELVRDYIPATRDGVVGLYDRENGGFVYDTRTPSGTGDHALVAGGTLPDCPCTDAYIEADGSSGLNARIYASADMRVEVDFAYTDLTRQQRVFGASSKPSFFIDSSDKFAFTGNDGASIQSGLAADMNRHTAVFDSAARKISIFTGATENWSKSLTAQQIDDPQPFALFANMHSSLGKDDNGFKFRHQAKVRIYGAKFYRAGQLVGSFRPCVKGGVAGFTDTESGDFVYGEKADAFTAGGDVERIADDPYVMLTGNNANAGAKKWINIGYFPGPTTKIVFDYALADNFPAGGNENDNNNWFLLCAYTAAAGGDAAERLNFAATPNGALRWKNGVGSTFESVSDSLGAATSQRNVRRRFIYDAANGSCVLCTAGFSNCTATSAATLTRKMANYPIRLGGDTTATPKQYAPLKIYGLKIYEGNELVRNFTPYVRDGVVGLKDSETGLFAADASSPKCALDAGGQIVADANSQDAYVEFTGAQTIDTGFKPTGDTCVVCDFQLTNTKDNPQQFVWSSNEMGHRIYTTGGNWGWIYNNSADGAKYTNKPIGLNRLTVTIDARNAHVSFVTNGVAFFEQTEDKSKLHQDAVCTSTMKIGSRFAANGTVWNFTSMKLYSFKVYEGGKLERDYVPCVQDGVVGLYDLVYGGFESDTQGTAPLKVGGVGTFVKPLEDTTIASGDGSTLGCLASGAVGYQWYKNGVAVEGATGATFTVPWRRGKPNQDVFSVVPTYDVFGVPTPGEESSATVTYRPNGLCIMFR